MTVMATMNHEVVEAVCGSSTCYPGDRCATCRLTLGDACESCGAPGETVGGMFNEVVLCASCKATEEGGA